MELSKITSAIINDLYGGTAGLTANPSISYEQIEDEVVEKRIAVIKELYHKGLISKGDLAVSINCIPVECKDIAECNNCAGDYVSGNKLEKWFEIPLLVDSLGTDSVIYLGSLDQATPYDVFFSLDNARSHQYRRRGANRPYIYINRTPNKNNMHDCWVYNAPFIKMISITGVFKDLRQLSQYNCCINTDYLDFGTISDEVKNRVKRDKTVFYREQRVVPTPTDLMPK